MSKSKDALDAFAGLLQFLSGAVKDGKVRTDADGNFDWQYFLGSDAFSGSLAVVQGYLDKLGAEDLTAAINELVVKRTELLDGRDELDDDLTAEEIRQLSILDTAALLLGAKQLKSTLDAEFADWAIKYGLPAVERLVKVGLDILV